LKWIWAVAGIVALVGAVPSAAEQRVTAGMHTFTDSEENRIETYVVELMQSVQRDWTLRLRGALDRVVLPPLPGLPGSQENVDAITAASRPVASAELSKEGYSKLRQEVTGNVDWMSPVRTWQAGASLYYSHESDYVGRQVSVNVGRHWKQGNTALALIGAHGFDEVQPEQHENGETGKHNRDTWDLTAVWTQTLGQRTLSQLGAETHWVQGFQSNPYRSVYAGGTRVPERHPERRFRRALFGRIDRYLMTRASVSLSARYYSDDWGVQAGTFDVRLNQYVGDHLIVRYRYRYHRQGAAYFFSDLYEEVSGVDGFVSGDYKLDDFDSNLFGVKFSVPFEGISVRPWMAGVVLDLKYERYFDSQSFAANVLEAGFTWPF
jgi:hypothetical protein